MSQDNKRPTTNTRKFRRDGEKKFLALVLFTLVFVGGGLIALIFGVEALLTALPCLLGGAGLMIGLWLLLSLGEWWLRRRDQYDRQILEAVNGSQSSVLDGDDE
jgi:hypothetical protein